METAGAVAEQGSRPAFVRGATLRNSGSGDALENLAGGIPVMAVSAQAE
jgi:hypothetical protein